MSSSQILALSCPDRPGIVAAVTGLLQRSGRQYCRSQQCNDTQSDQFFMRVAFDVDALQSFRTAFDTLAQSFHMDWRLRDAARAKRVLILVSKFDHCLVDLLYRTRLGELDMNIVGIVSNHPRDAIHISKLQGAPFHHLPVTKATKADQEARLMTLIDDRVFLNGARTVVFD